MGCRDGREDGARDGGDPWDGDFAGKGRVAKDLGRSVEVTERVGGDYHNGFLSVAVVHGVMGWVMGGGGERVGEE